MDTNNELILIDKEALIAQFGGDEEILQEIIIEFINMYPEMLKAIETAIITNDAHALHQSAHSFKGAVSNFFAQKITDQALKLEQLGKNGQVTGAQEMFSDLSQDVVLLVMELKKLGKLG